MAQPTHESLRITGITAKRTVVVDVTQVDIKIPHLLIGSIIGRLYYSSAQQIYLNGKSVRFCHFRYIASKRHAVYKDAEGNTFIVLDNSKPLKVGQYFLKLQKEIAGLLREITHHTPHMFTDILVNKYYEVTKMAMDSEYYFSKDQRKTLRRIRDNINSCIYSVAQAEHALLQPIPSTSQATSILEPSLVLENEQDTDTSSNTSSLLYGQDEIFNIELDLEPQMMPFSISLTADEELSSNLRDLNDTLKELKLDVAIDSSFKDTIEKLVSKLDTVKVDVNHKSSAFDILTNIISEMKDSLPTFVVLIIVSVFIAKFLHNGSVNNRLFIGIFLGAIIANFIDLRPVLGSLLEKFSLGEQQLESQSGGSVEDITNVIVGMLNSYMVMAKGTDIFSSSALTSIISTISRTSSGVKPIIEGINVLFSYVLYAVDKWFNKNPQAFIKSGLVFVDEYFEEFNKLRLDSENHVLMGNKSALDMTRNMILKGESLLLKIPNDRSCLAIKLRVNNTLSELNTIKKSLLATNFKFNGCRQEPASLMMRGPPGCGKSLAMQHLAHAIAALTFTPEDYKVYQDEPALFTYNRQAENVYWEGYDSMKRILFLDDLLQARDVAGNADNEIMNVIRAINVFENQLHCAAIANKGNTTFRSQFVIANTNMQNYNFESINDMGAFLRRWDVVVDVCPKIEYCVDPNAPIWARKLDYSKLPQVADGISINGECTITQLHPNLLEFHVMKLDGRKFEGTGMCLDFDGLVKFYKNVYDRKERWFQQYLKDLKNTLDNWRSDYLVPQGTSTDIAVKDVLNHYDIEPSEFGEYIDNIFTPSSYAKLQLLQNTSIESIVLFYSVMENLSIYEFPKWGVNFNNNEMLDAYETLFGLTAHSELAINEVQRRSKLMLEHLVSLVPKESDKLEVSTSEKTCIISRFANLQVPEMLIRAYNYLLKAISYFDLSFGFGYLKSMNVYPFSTMSDSTLLKCTSLVCIGSISFGTCALVTAIVKSFSIVVNWINGPIVVSQSNERLLKVARHRKPKPTIKTITVESQGMQTSNANLRDVVYSVLRKNMYEVYIPLAKSKRRPNASHSRYGFAIAIRGRTLMMPWHFMSEMTALWKDDKELDGDDIVELHKIGLENHNCLLTVSELYDAWQCFDIDESKDVTFLTMPDHFQPARNVSHLFVNDKMLELFSKVSATIVVPYDGQLDINSREAKEFISVFATRVDQPVGVKRVIDDNGKEKYDYYIDQSYHYSAPMSKGDCGSVLFSNDLRNGSRILGFHVAGIEKVAATNEGYGVSTIITQNYLDERMKSLNENYDLIIPEVYKIIPTSIEEPTTSVIGLMPKALSSHGSGNTKLRKSPLHGKWGPAKTRPAPLRPFLNRLKEVVNPMKIGQKKLCKPDVYIPDYILTEAVASFEDMLYHTSSKFVAEKEILTFEEAVLGDKFGVLGSIPRTTSAGFPHSFTKHPKTKEYFFGTGLDYDLTNSAAQDLKQLVTDIRVAATFGQRYLHAYIDCMKDERRAHEKCDDGKTRLFYSIPTALLVSFRMFFGSFMRWIISNAIENGMAVGISEYTNDWDVLARMLNQFGDGQNKGAGDYAGFDFDQRARMQWKVLHMINKWYGNSEDSKIRAILWLEITSSIHINGDLLTEWFGSFPSGNFLTMIVNNSVNHISMRCCWIDIFGDCSMFNTCVYLVTAGDDQAYSVRLDYADRFREVDIAPSMLKLGFTYTSELKSSTFLDKLRAIDKITFLKRKFVYDNRRCRYVAPLDLDVILEIPYWVKDGASAIADVENNLKIAFEELSLHDQNTYTLWSDKMKKAVEGTRVNLPFNTYYNSLRNEVLNRSSTIEQFVDLII